MRFSNTVIFKHVLTGAKIKFDVPGEMTDQSYQFWLRIFVAKPVDWVFDSIAPQNVPSNQGGGLIQLIGKWLRKKGGAQ